MEALYLVLPVVAFLMSIGLIKSMLWLMSYATKLAINQIASRAVIVHRPFSMIGFALGILFCLYVVVTSLSFMLLTIVILVLSIGMILIYSLACLAMTAQISEAIRLLTISRQTYTQLLPTIFNAHTGAKVVCFVYLLVGFVLVTALVLIPAVIITGVVAFNDAFGKFIPTMPKAPTSPYTPENPEAPNWYRWFNTPSTPYPQPQGGQ